MPGTHSRTLTATAQIRMRKTRGLSPSFLNQKTKKPSDLLGSDGGSVPPMAYLVTPTGVEPVLPP